jgi:hypothetical protein
MTSSHVLMMHGLNVEELNETFKLPSFDLVDAANCETVAAGGNGFVVRLAFNHNNYMGYYVIKTSIKETSDNAMYEYTVGQYVNELMRKFPCFIRTISLLRYNSKKAMMQLAKAHAYTNEMLASLHPTTPSIEASCTSPTTQCLLLDDVYGGVNLRECITPAFATTELPFILFIIYHALSMNRKTFTHYDLHDHNVLLYEPFPPTMIHSGRWVQYVYHLPNTELTFLSKYIPKIIDYGRCYFQHGSVGSKKYRKVLCKTMKCNRPRKCGVDVGYRNVAATDPTKVTRSSFKNESQDVRLLSIVGNTLSTMLPDHPFTKLCRKTVFGEGFGDSTGRYGTVEHLKSSTHHIYNVKSAYEELLAYVQDNNPDMSRKIGSIVHVYEDRPMKVELL